MKSLIAAGLLISMPPLLVGQNGKTLDVPYVPTRPDTVEEMLDMADVKEGDRLYDLGSGDGRIVIAAASRGADALGIDMDPDRVAEARENAEAAGVTDRAEFIEGDLFEFDFSDADVLTMYLLPDVNMRLRPQIQALEPGTRVVSHAFDLGDWQADEVSTVSGQTVYLWIVPADVKGDWSWESGGHRYQVSLEQEFQRLSGSASVDDRPAQLREAELRGQELSLVIVPEDGEPRRFSARYEDGRLVGEGSEGCQFTAERPE